MVDNSDSSDVPTESRCPIPNLFSEMVQNPVNIFLLGVITILLYRIIKRSFGESVEEPVKPNLPKLQKDFTLEELKKYNGTQADGRILIAVNGFVYDVTEAKQFYGPGGPYAAFAGRDASRGLATFSVVSNEDGYDDLSDLSPTELASLREWELQFQQKYEFVGALLKPGERPYS
ncbi:hypothetical protein R5R35_000751 [Gryllus longicercus]|uniref:Cytochrome b5 heme-binding domain-containing protein n=1 Tax=Gryllus longicercus TaxID=2509291 RepID=A0AAN9ZDG9_9ORTH